MYAGEKPLQDFIGKDPFQQFITGIARAQAVTVGNVRNGHYCDAVTGRSVEVTDGSLAFQVNANSAGIYVLNGPGKIGVDGLYLR